MLSSLGQRICEVSFSTATGSFFTVKHLSSFAEKGKESFEKSYFFSFEELFLFFPYVIRVHGKNLHIVYFCHFVFFHSAKVGTENEGLQNKDDMARKSKATRLISSFESLIPNK